MTEIKRRTIFVVGAGASKEFDLPTGRELLDKISEFRTVNQRSDSHYTQVSLKDDESGSLHNAMVRLAHELAPTKGVDVNHALRLLRTEALWITRNCRIAPSIDNLLHAHSSNDFRAHAGKLLIVKALAEAESKSTLAPDPDPEKFDEFLFKGIRRTKTGTDGSSKQEIMYSTNSWLGELFWLLVENRTFPEFLSSLESYAFISFNYDRCIQHFLANAAISYFELDQKSAQLALDAIHVVHPYGSLGKLRIDHNRVRGFGESGKDFERIAAKIRVFTEKRDNTSIAVDIDACLQSAETVVFLGFGFLNLNMELLFQNNIYNARRVIGTCLGLSPESSDVVRKTATEHLFFGKDSHELRSAKLPISNPDYFLLSDCTCRALMDKHRMYFRSL